MENKIGIIKQMEKTLDMTRFANGIKIKYGYVKHENAKEPYDTIHTYAKRNFVECETVDEAREHGESVLITVDGYTMYQSIAGDSGVSIISDIMKVIDKMM